MKQSRFELWRDEEVVAIIIRPTRDEALAEARYYASFHSPADNVEILEDVGRDEVNLVALQDAVVTH